MMRRSSALLAVNLITSVKPPPAAGELNTKHVKDDVKKPSTNETFVYIPAASEAPELLKAYVEPKPFISARRLQVFIASLGIGAACVGGVYFLLSRSLSGCHDLEQQNLLRIVESNRLAMTKPEDILPDFSAPGSFEELKTKMQQHERALERRQEEIRMRTVMLHTEAVFRFKVWWNACLTHLQEACCRFGTAQQKRKEHRAVGHIEEALRYEGYELVKLRSGKTHIW